MKNVRKKFHQPRWVRHAVLGPSKLSKRWNSQLSTHNAIWHAICSDKINVAEKIPPKKSRLVVFIFFVFLVCRIRCCLGVCTLTCRFQRDLLQQSHKVLYLINDFKKNDNCGAKRTTKFTWHYNFFCQSRRSAEPSRLLRCAWLCIEGLPFLSLFAFPCLATGNVSELVQLAVVFSFIHVYPIHPIRPCVCRWPHWIAAGQPGSLILFFENFGEFWSWVFELCGFYHVLNDGMIVLLFCGNKAWFRMISFAMVLSYISFSRFNSKTWKTKLQTDQTDSLFFFWFSPFFVFSNPRTKKKDFELQGPNAERRSEACAFRWDFDFECFRFWCLVRRPGLLENSQEEGVR